MPSGQFVPNDVRLGLKDTDDDQRAIGRVQIITGPNMAGKSTYIRQVALLALLAHGLLVAALTVGVQWKREAQVIAAEAELFEKMRDLAKDKTAILISHRFSTVKLADRICVIEHGQVQARADLE